jgi:beta-lactamase regulating signal transducer with metallopeptidase domain
MGRYYDLFVSGFYTLFFMSVVALIIGAAILLFRRLTKRQVSPFWRYAIWVCLLLALLMPFRPQSRASLVSPIENLQNLSVREEYYRSAVQYRPLLDAMPAAFRNTQAGREHNLLRLNYIVRDALLPAVWLGGIVLLIISINVGRGLIKINLTKHQSDADSERILLLLHECKKQLAITADFEVVIQDYIKSPALFGIVKPKIILPTYVADLDCQAIRYILLHELGHYKRGDLLLNQVMLIVKIIYWFNPLIWVLFKYVREDIEYANDAFVLYKIGEENAKDYSLTLVEAVKRVSENPFLPRVLYLADTNSNIASRIKSIKGINTYKKHRFLAAAVSVLTGLFLCMFFMTGQVTAQVDEPDINKFVGNWIWGDFLGGNGMYTFLADGTVGFSSASNETERWVWNLKGSFTLDSENGMLYAKYNNSSGRILTEVDYVEYRYAYTFSMDKNSLFFENFRNSRNLVRTRYPSMMQLSFGTWEGFLHDGSAVSVVFHFNNTIDVRIEKDGVLVEFYAGEIQLYEGWARLTMTVDDASWDAYLASVARNVYLIEKFHETGEWEEFPTITHQPAFTVTARQDIIISVDGDTLLLPNFWARDGELVEVVRVLP